MGNDNEMEYSMITDEERKNERMDRERAELKQENAALKAEMLTHKQPEPPDSWEKLLGDLDRATNCEISACCYASNAEKPCKSCKFNRWSNCVGHIFADIADRIRTLMEER